MIGSVAAYRINGVSGPVLRLHFSIPEEIALKIPTCCSMMVVGLGTTWQLTPRVDGIGPSIREEVRPKHGSRYVLDVHDAGYLLSELTPFGSSPAEYIVEGSIIYVVKNYGVSNAR